MGGDAALRYTVARVRRALPGSQYAQYGVRQFCSLQVSEICCFYGRTTGSDAHHDKPIAADFKCEVCHTSPGG